MSACARPLALLFYSIDVLVRCLNLRYCMAIVEKKKTKLDKNTTTFVTHRVQIHRDETKYKVFPKPLNRSIPFGEALVQSPQQHNKQLYP